MAVQVIKATKSKTSQAVTQGRGDLLRVAAYCRVSTDSDEQETSYEAQCLHYTNFIENHEGWCLAGIYADEGISGTSTKKREQFNNMIADCEAGLIDMVITKSISRWARNTIDSLQSIRKLKSLGIGVLFEKEGIHTLDANGEILITVMSSLAQQESDSISKNVRMGIQYQMQQGKGRLNTAHFLGLTRDPDTKTLVIIPEEAALIRRIYRQYLEGFSPGMIAAQLTADEILTPAGKETWYSSTVISILSNEKYCGDLLLQKYYVVDFLTHKVARNNGDLPQYFVEDAHEPIIPKEIFYQVQGEMQRRSLLRYDPSKIRYGSKQALNRRLICGHCGRALKRYKGPGHTEWRCRRRAYEKKSVSKESQAACDCRNVLEKDVKRAILAAFNELPRYRIELIRMQGALWDGTIRQLDERIAGLREQQNRLAERLDELVYGSNDRSDGMEESIENGDEEHFIREELDRVEQEYTELVMKRATAVNDEVQIRLLLELVDDLCGEEDEAGAEDKHKNQRYKNRNEKKEKNKNSGACYDYEEFFRRTRRTADENMIMDGRVSSFNNEMVIRYLEKVMVNDRDYEVKFKAGLTVSIPAK